MAVIEKRVIKVCLLLAAVIILLAAFTLQASAESYTFTDGNGISWSYKMTTYEGDSCAEITGCSSIPESGEITVPGYIDEKPVIIGEKAFEGKKNPGLRKVSLSMGVTGIGRQAFYGCADVETVTLPLSLRYIDDLAFHGCYSLSTFALNEGLKSVYLDAFYECHNLRNVRIPASVESISVSQLAYEVPFESITVDSGNKQYKDIEGVLYSKNGDTVISYPKGKNGTSYVIADGVTYVGDYAFAGCELTEVTVPDTAEVIGVGAFYHSARLQTVHMGEGVKSIEYRAFESCTSLKSPDLPQKLNRIGEEAFNSCTSIRSISVPTSVTYIGSGAFKHCLKLTTVELPDNLGSDPNSVGTGLFYETNIDQNFRIPSGWTSIPGYTFKECNNLKHIVIPDTVESISSVAFQSCHALKDVFISSEDTVIEDNAFGGSGVYEEETGNRQLVICSAPGSLAEEFAKSSGLSFAPCTPEEYAETMRIDAPVYTVDDPSEDPSGDNPGTGGSGETGGNGGNDNSGTGGGGTSGTASGSSGKTVMTGTAAVPAAEKVKKTSGLAKPKFKAKNKKGRKVKLSWSKVKNADGYMIYVKGPKDKKFRRRVTKSARVKSITHKGLIKGKKYKYKIAAFKVVKGVKKRGPFSKTITVKIRK